MPSDLRAAAHLVLAAFIMSSKEPEVCPRAASTIVDCHAPLPLFQPISDSLSMLLTQPSSPDLAGVSTTKFTPAAVKASYAGGSLASFNGGIPPWSKAKLDSSMNHVTKAFAISWFGLFLLTAIL